MMDFLKRLFQRKTEPGPAVAVSPSPTPAFVADTQQTATAPLNIPAFSGSDSPLRVAHAQSVGRVRDHNEDVLLTLTSTFDGDEKIPSFGLYIVADGMGGHSLGERASAVAARSVAREVTKRVYLSLLSDSNDNEDRAPLQEVLLEALTQANVAVREAVGEGGTTGTVALVFNDQMIIGHVGDSRAYLITANGLEQLTRDHSLVRRLQELGQLTQAEAAVHPQRNVLYRAIGQGEGLEVDVYTQRLTPDTKILLCSDGLWGLVEDDQILEVVRNAPSLQAACDKLVEMANDAGGHDNITSVLIEYSP
jgi:protein phosphatase